MARGQSPSMRVVTKRPRRPRGTRGLCLAPFLSHPSLPPKLNRKPQSPPPSVSPLRPLIPTPLPYSDWRAPPVPLPIRLSAHRPAAGPQAPSRSPSGASRCGPLPGRCARTFNSTVRIGDQMRPTEHPSPSTGIFGLRKTPNPPEHREEGGSKPVPTRRVQCSSLLKTSRFQSYQRSVQLRRRRRVHRTRRTPRTPSPSCPLTQRPVRLSLRNGRIPLPARFCPLPRRSRWVNEYTLLQLLFCVLNLFHTFNLSLKLSNLVIFFQRIFLTRFLLGLQNFPHFSKCTPIRPNFSVRLML